MPILWHPWKLLNCRISSSDCYTLERTLDEGYFEKIYQHPLGFTQQHNKHAGMGNKATHQGCRAPPEIPGGPQIQTYFCQAQGMTHIIFLSNYNQPLGSA